MTSTARHSSGRRSEPLVTGEFAFSASDFREIADLVKAVAGIDLPETKATLVYSRLAKRLRAIGVATFSDYCETVRDDEDERASMIAALTTNVTRFFREPHHFEHLRRSVLEPLVEPARKGRRIRLWSAACSTGQEPYSMALTVLSAFPDAASLDIRILATDLNPHVLARGHAGLYREDELHDVPAQMRARWFAPAIGEPGTLEIAEEVRSLIAFRTMNLMEDWPLKGPFDAIFCRNVVIYFDRATQGMIWKRMTRLLESKGALYIGHSERISGPATENLTLDGITTYRPRKGCAP